MCENSSERAINTSEQAALKTSHLSGLLLEFDFILVILDQFGAFKIVNLFSEKPFSRHPILKVYYKMLSYFYIATATFIDVLVNNMHHTLILS